VALAGRSGKQAQQCLSGVSLTGLASPACAGLCWCRVTVAAAVIEPASSLSLQQLLYYNSLYSMIHCVFVVGMLVWKVRARSARASRLGRGRFLQVTNIDMNIIMKFVVPIFSVVWVLAEAIRLMLGLSGNIRERVPELAAFLLLTVFPQIPVVAFLSLGALNRTPIDYIIGIPQLAMLFLEAIFAYFTVRRFMRKQTAEFFRACQTDPQGGTDGDQGDDGSDALSEGSVLSDDFPSAGEVLAAGVAGLVEQVTPRSSKQKQS